MVEREEISITIEDDIGNRSCEMNVSENDIIDHSFTVLGPHGGIRQKFLDMGLDVSSPVGIVEDRTYSAILKWGLMYRPVEFTDKGNHVLIEETDL